MRLKALLAQSNETLAQTQHELIRLKQSHKTARQSQTLHQQTRNELPECPDQQVRITDQLRRMLGDEKEKTKLVETQLEETKALLQKSREDVIHVRRQTMERVEEDRSNPNVASNAEAGTFKSVLTKLQHELAIHFFEDNQSTSTWEIDPSFELLFTLDTAHLLAFAFMHPLERKDYEAKKVAQRQAEIECELAAAAAEMADYEARQLAEQLKHEKAFEKAEQEIKQVLAEQDQAKAEAQAEEERLEAQAQAEAAAARERLAFSLSALVGPVFDIYDLDDSGSIDTIQELTQLTTAMSSKLRGAFLISYTSS